LALAVLEGRFLEGDKVTADIDEKGELVFTNLGENARAAADAGESGDGASSKRKKGAGAAAGR
jgi:hypothetical protein